MPDLHLNLKAEYFNEIKSGVKPDEYRLYNDYWKKRLEGREYENIQIKSGYPAKGDAEKIITIPYKGYTVKKIQHPHFHDCTEPVEVFAIHLYEPKLERLDREGQLRVGDSIWIHSKSNTLLPVTVAKIYMGDGHEEIIYNSKCNQYFITNMVLDGSSWHGTVDILRPNYHE